MEQDKGQLMSTFSLHMCLQCVHTHIYMRIPTRTPTHECTTHTHTKSGLIFLQYFVLMFLMQPKTQDSCGIIILWHYVNF